MNTSTEQELAIATTEIETVSPTLSRFREFIKGAEQRSLESAKRPSTEYYIRLEAELYVKLLGEMSSADWYEQEYKSIRDERNRLELELALGKRGSSC